ncbi:hypothetical protein I7I50_03194 [Histoplasma capsulatum G186AR]|nr:hypothetical protein I7I50_03194 [Histoplasma capsulatum G186AR]
MNGCVEWGSRRPLFSLFFLFLYPSCFSPVSSPFSSLPSFSCFCFFIIWIFVYYDFFLYVHFSLMCFAVDTLFSHSILLLGSLHFIYSSSSYFCIFCIFFLFFFFFFFFASSDCPGPKF